MLIKQKNFPKFLHTPLLAAASLGLLFGLGVVFGPTNVAKADCAGVDTAIIDCKETGKGKDLENNGVWALLLMLIRIMTAGVGVLAVGGLAYGAFLWTTAGGNSSQIAKSKEVMFNVVVGIVTFALMWSLLQFLIPGGVFK